MNMKRSSVFFFFFLDQILHHIVNFRAFNGKKKGVEVLKEICRAWNER